MSKNNCQKNNKNQKQIQYCQNCQHFSKIVKTFQILSEDVLFQPMDGTNFQASLSVTKWLSDKDIYWAVLDS